MTAGSVAEPSLGTDVNGQSILWRESFTIGEHPYRAEVTPHWFAGHGRVEGRYRWTVYYENEYEPVVGQGVWGDTFGAKRQFRRWLEDYRVAVAGETMRRNQF